MAKKKKQKRHSLGDYDPTSPGSHCAFCSGDGRYYVEYECGNIRHRHPAIAVCKACCWLLSQLTGGQFTIHTKQFDGKEALAQMKADALNAVQEMLDTGAIQGTHDNEHMRKTPPRIERDFWGE